MSTYEPEPRIDELEIYADGASRGNPGPAAIGIVFVAGGKPIKTHKEYIGNATNNEAEYMAVQRALELAGGLCRRKVKCNSDSALVINQMNGGFRIKNERMRKMYLETKNLAGMFQEIKFFQVAKSHPFIVAADELANRVLDIVAPEKLDKRVIA